MAKTESRTLNIYIQSGEAQKALDNLLSKEKQLKDELVKATDPRTVKNLEAALDRLKEPIDRATKKLKGDLTPSFRDAEATVRKLGIALKSATDPKDIERLTREYREATVALESHRRQLGLVKQAGASLAKENPFGRMFDFAKGALIASGITAATQGITQFFGDAVDEAIEAEQATARLRVTLDNLGRTDAFDRLNAKANEMAATFKYIDNDEVLGVFEKLIDYGKLTETQITDLLPVIINFAAKQGISISDSADTIIKALAGNGKALKGYGINMADAKTDAERLALVMDTLAKKVDGAGEAFQNSTTGGLAAARQQFANLKEDTGNKLLPILTNVYSFFNKVLDAANNMRQVMRDAWQDIKNISQFGFEGANALAAARDLIRKKEANAGKIGDAAAGAAKSDNKVLGFGDDDNKNDAAAKEKDRLKKQQQQAAQLKTQRQQDARREHEKIIADRKRLAEEFDKLSLELLGEGQHKELKLLEKKYTDLRELAHGDKKQLLEAETRYQEERRAINNKYFLDGLAAVRERTAEEIKVQEKANAEKISKAILFVKKLEEAIASATETFAQDQKAKRELDLELAKGKKKLKLKKEALKAEEDEEIKAALKNNGLRGDQEHIIQNIIAGIKKQYRDLENEEEKSHIIGTIEKILVYAQHALDIYTVFANAKAQRENADLNRDKAINDKKKRNLEARLKSGVVTQLEHDREIEKIQRESEKKEAAIRLKQFKRDQRIQITQTLMNAAEGGIKLWASPGFPAAIPLLAILAIQTAASIASISSKKPTFERGGRLLGPSHAENNGMPVVDPRSGHVQAYLEGGEGIVNKKSMQDRNVYAASGTPSQITSILNAKHGGVHWESGAQFIPAWSVQKMKPINFPAINAAIENTRMYARGGMYDQRQSVTDTRVTEDIEMKQTMLNMNDIMLSLKSQLQKPIKAYSVITEQEAQQNRLDAIRDDATMR